MRQTHNTVFILLLLSFTFQPAASSQSEKPDRPTPLEQPGFYPYPADNEIEDSKFSSKGFRVSPLSADDINT